MRRLSVLVFGLMSIVVVVAAAAVRTGDGPGSEAVVLQSPSVLETLLNATPAATRTPAPRPTARPSGIVQGLPPETFPGFVHTGVWYA